MSNYKPITRRTMEARSSMLKQTTADDEDKMTSSGQVQDDQGNLYDATGEATKGSQTVENFKSTNRAKKGSAQDKKNKSYLKDCEGGAATTKSGEPCDDFLNRWYGKKVTNTPGDSRASYDQKLTEEQRGSSIDLFTSPEGRASFRTGQSQGRFVRKTGRQFANAEDKLAKFIAKKGTPGPGEPGYRKYKKLLNKRDTFKSQSEGAQKRFENYRQMTDGMRNPYVTKRMEYNRKLQSQEIGGQPVKAPEGTQTMSEFEEPLEKFAGKTSNQPVGNTGTVTSFSSLLSNDSFQPVKVGDGDLFSNIDLSGFSKGLTDKLQKKISGMSMPSANRMLKKPGAFKMKGYGSKK